MNLALLAFGGFLLAAAPVFLRRPAWAAFAFAFLLLLHANLVLSFDYKVGLTDPLLFGAMLGLVAVYPLLYGDTPVGSGRFLAACALWLAAVLNSYIWSTSAGVSVATLQNFLPNVLYAWVMFQLVADRQRLIGALGGLYAATLLLSTLTVIQVALGMPRFDFLGLANGSVDHIANGVDAIRPTGPVTDPNYYCQILLPGFALALTTALAAPSRRLRLFGLAATGLVLMAIMLTASRGGVLAAGVATFGLLLAYRRLHYLAVVSLPVLALLYFVPSYFDRLSSLVTSFTAILTGQANVETSVSGRLSEMKAAAILFMEHPFAGIGFGMFETRYQDISANFDMMLRGADRSAHSLYLETGAEQGMMGLAALIFMLVAALRATQLAYRRAVQDRDSFLASALLALAAGAVGLFVSSLFLHDAFAQHFWLVLALLFAAERATGARTHYVLRERTT